jgi:hypothetical protein
MYSQVEVSRNYITNIDPILSNITQCLKGKEILEKRDKFFNSYVSEMH